VFNEGAVVMKNVFIGAAEMVALGFTLLFAGGSDMLKIGENAPDFSLVNSNGDTVSLRSFAGKSYIVLVFYPGDQTLGCTKQLCAIRDDYTGFEAKNTKVFGVNPGDIASHRKFIKRYSFPFPLLIDEGRKTAKLYGCGGSLFVKRTVYVIDPNGVIIYAKRGMPPIEEILNAIPGKRLTQ
jgi:thioredoxin-dependent peroxiredoxin